LFRSKPLPGISTERKTKTPGSAFGDKHEKHLVIICDDELLRGVLDKAAFSATYFSLVDPKSSALTKWWYIYDATPALKGS
jgi:hypothetical protein